MIYHTCKRIFILLLFSLVFISCSHVHIKKVKPSQVYRIGILPFDFSAPLNDPDDFMDKDFIPKDQVSELVVKNEKTRITELARTYLIEKLKHHDSLEIISLTEELNSKDFDDKEINEKLTFIAREKNLDHILFVGIPWYGKTNIIYPIIGLTTDIAVETVIIGVVTKWNPTIIWANVGLELLTNTPLWFGGSYLFGASFRPVELDVKLWSKDTPEKINSDDVEIFVSKKILKDYPEEERKKKSVQLEASLKKAINELTDEFIK